MPLLSKRWLVPAPLPADVDRQLYAFPAFLRQVLYNRGHTTHESAWNYLQAQTPSGCDPFFMLGIPQAVERLELALKRQEPIAVYGDYDADGVTATALLVQALGQLGAQVQGYIPNRFDEGYGINNEALGWLHDQGVKLVVSVDCGIRSLAEAEYAYQLGLDLIISDHHHPSHDLPRALAVINPKQPGDTYPDKDLAGVGLAYKIATALGCTVKPQSWMAEDWPAFQPEMLLDLVAIGTVADLAPLKGENRALVKAGMAAIRQPRRQGLLSLMGAAGIKPSRLTGNDIGFALGPRLNAAGRLDSAMAAYRLLLTQDIQEAGRLAQQLDGDNRKRQQITREIQAVAEQIALTERPDALLLFAAHPDFNPGVVGLAASRLSEVYYRPAIVAQLGETYTRGSCRSIPEFHITEALDQCADLLEHHGGHAAAAGFTVRSDRLPLLVERLQAIANQSLSSLDLRPTLYADYEIQLKELRPEFIDYLELLQPTGQGNRAAVFVSRDLKVSKSKTVGKDNTHLKLSVTDGWITFDAIAFRQGHWQEQMPPRIDLMYTFELNEFNGNTTLQLNVIDLKPSGVPD